MSTACNKMVIHKKDYDSGVTIVEVKVKVRIPIAASASNKLDFKTSRRSTSLEKEHLL